MSDEVKARISDPDHVRVMRQENVLRPVEVTQSADGSEVIIIGSDGEVIKEMPRWYYEKLVNHGLNWDGSEITDPRPMAAQVNMVKEPNMFDVMRAAVQAEVRRRIGDEEEETPEDAADMGPDDEDEFIEELSQYERHDLEVALAIKTDRENRAMKGAGGDPPEVPEGPDGGAGGKSGGGAPESPGGGDKPSATV